MSVILKLRKGRPPLEKWSNCHKEKYIFHEIISWFIQYFISFIKSPFYFERR